MALKGWKKSKQNQNVDKAADKGDDMPPRKFNPLVLGGVAGLVLAIIAAVFMARSFVTDELVRESQLWQVRLGIVPDSRAQDVDDWVDENFKKLRELG